ncbi:glycoside hydrolase family 25 protein [Nocardia sp. NBC_01327]|uniref:glycoside hydrolase family 25 protein n=1 Tax=Nocardia sp. NBC_01327 TaxID=2903593 RepID=UPI002E164A50|nr:GH25 family lysozyme [Nocardia sp. NBC_01327]
MTLFGIDISNNNGAGIDMSQVRSEGFDFVFCKVSQGDSFADATWPRYRDAALDAGLLVAGYHYLEDGDPHTQAAWYLRHLGDGGRCGVMVDFEAGSGNEANYWGFVNAVNALGRTVNLSYEPRWYWDQIGDPDLTQLPGLIQSSYVSGTGFAAALYPGDGSPMWSGFGGAQVQILQFTDAAQAAGHVVDANAFRGSRTELAGLLGLPIDNPGGTVTNPVPDPGTPADLALRVADIETQLRGPGLTGWPQLGTNTAGANLTLVDAIAALRADVATLLARVPVPPVVQVKAAF